MTLLNRWRRFLHRIDVDRPVAYNLLSTCSLLCTRPLIAFLVAFCFSSVLQGYFFTFYSIVSLHVFVELGLSFVVVQFASHEFAGLTMRAGCELEGEPQSLARLHGLSQLTLRWYFLAGCIVALGLSLIGLWFFSSSSQTNWIGPWTPQVNWRGPWVSLSVLTGIRLWLTPIWALLEGCNQIVPVYRYRFWDTVLSAAAICGVVLGGGGLWMAPAATLVSLLCSVYHLVRHCGKFLKFLGKRANSIPFPWLDELWPMQWRIAATWGSSYLANHLPTAVVFHYQGAVLGGQIGMTWNLCTVLVSLASTWQVSRNPRLGMLTAQRDWTALDSLFARVYAMSLLVSSLAFGSAFLEVVAINHSALPLATHLAQRILPPVSAGLFFLGGWVYQLYAPLAIYLRAHKREPLFSVMVVYSVSMGAATLIWGSQYGPLAVGAAYAIVNALTLPAVLWVWLRCRKAWHT